MDMIYWIGQQPVNGNITGIYDMSGGNWEYVMGNMVDSTGNFYPSSSGLTKPWMLT